MSNTFSGLDGGNYQVMVKDANLCETAILSIDLSEPAAGISFTTTVTDVQCFGNTDGEIIVAASGGTPVYEYSMDDGVSYQISNVFSNLLAGDYLIKVRDSENCVTASVIVTVGSPNDLPYFGVVVTNILCFGAATGEIVVTANGGTAPYTYSIDDGISFQSSNIFSGLTAATYNVVIQDVQSCISSVLAVSITEPSSAISFTTTSTDVTCFGATTGEIIITATGANPPYTYSNNGGISFQSSNVFTDLAAGIYEIIVQDNYSCTSTTTSVLISQPATAVSFATDITHVLCFGDATGGIIVSAVGGSPSYLYSIDNGITYQVSNDFPSLPSGDYDVVVKDALDCISSQLITINEPIEIEYTYNAIAVACFGGNDGEITIFATGGVEPYQYSSDAGITYQSSNIFEDLIAGNYEVWVLDDHLCVESQTITISEPSSLPDASFTGLDATYCNNDGMVILTGSQAPFGSFSGDGITDNNDGTAYFDPIAVGIGSHVIMYSFTDGDGCFNSSSQETNIYEVPNVSFSLLNTEYCIDHDDILLTGNHAPEGTFSGIGVFDNGNGTATFNPSAAGVGGPYDIVYTYVDGDCSSSQTQQTTINAVPTVLFTGLSEYYCVNSLAVTLYGNHAPEGNFSGLGITDNGDGTAIFDPSVAGVVSNGQIIYSYTDPSFCMSSQTQTVDVFDLPIVGIMDLESNYCLNNEDVIILGYPLPDNNTSGYFVGEGIIDNGDGTAVFSPSSLNANNVYTIQYFYADVNACDNSASQVVNIIDLPESPTSSDVSVCFGETVPDLTATGNSGFELNWFDADGNWLATGESYSTGIVDVGSYEFSVKQTHTVTGCESNSTPVYLYINDLPLVEIPDFNDVCIDDYIIYLTTGTPQGGNYSGSNGILQMPNGSYIFHPEYGGAGVHDIIYTYIDSNTGCENIASTTLTVNNLPIVEIVDIEDIYCIQSADVILHGNYTGEGQFFGDGITDNGDGTAVFSPSSVGEGGLTIVYSYLDPITGCHSQDSASTFIEGAPENVSYITVSEQELCVNSGGTITLRAYGGDGTWVNWFENSCNGSRPEILSATVDSTLIVINAPTVSTYYLAQWETECGVSDICAENYILVTPLPTTPDTYWATPDVICSEDQDSVALYITGGNYGEILKWTQDSCSGVSLGQTNGDFLMIPTPDTTTLYFAKWMNSCGESACTEKVRVRVEAPAQEVVIADADSNYFCINTLDEIQLRSFGGVGDTVIWYYDVLGINPVPTDSIVYVSEPRGDTINIIPPTINTVYYPFRVGLCGQAGGNIEVEILVFKQPISPDVAYTSPAIICYGQSDSITLYAEGGSGTVLEWYADDCENGMFIGNGNGFKILPPSITTSYYARWTSPCGYSICAETVLEVHAAPVEAELITSDTNNICAGNLSEIQLVMVGGSGDSVVWFADVCGGEQLDPSAFLYQSPMRDTILIPAPTSDTTFYAYWATPCESTSCVELDITIYPLPIIMDTIYSNYNNFCSGSLADITLNAIGGSGTEISWTEGSCDGPLLGVTTTGSIIIPSPQDTTVYYAKWKTICDSSDCKAIQVNVAPTPQDPEKIVLLEEIVCENAVDSITLVLEGGSGYRPVWFYGPYCGADTIPDEAITKLTELGDVIRIERPAQSQVISANWASLNNTCGSSECVSENVFVFEAPIASFMVSDAQTCENSIIKFTPNSLPGSGIIESLQWYFGDGAVVDTNIQVDIYHSYTNFGQYDVQLIVTNDLGCSDTTSLQIIISEAPQAAFSYQTTCLGEDVLFTDESISAVDSIASWLWDFNDPSSITDTSSLQNPSYIYSNAGLYEVNLTITDTTGCTNQVSQEVVIAPHPTAYFTLGTASCQNAPVFFNDSSYTINSEIGTWIWNFGDGSPDSVIIAPNTPDIWYAYSDNGTYTVSLKAIDTAGCHSETFYKYFTVRSTPIAGFMHSDTACQTGIINFFDTTYHAAGTSAVSWQWDFGDGNYGYNQNPAHSYIETGQFYDVQMIVIDEYGCSDSIVQPVEVKPSMQISFTSNIVCQNEATELVATLLQPEGDQVAEWRWFFGDGAEEITDTDTISHTYALGGTYYATLVGVDDGGCEAIVINQAVNVNYGPEIDYYVPLATCNDPSIFYNNSVSNADGFILYEIRFGDGAYATYTAEDYPDPLAHHYPAGSSQYTAVITLTNTNGCESTSEVMVYREACISVEDDMYFSECSGQTVQFIDYTQVNHEDIVIDSIKWDFGDGHTFEAPYHLGDTVYHVYNDLGAMDIQVSLKLLNNGVDFTENYFHSIFINATPNAEFRVSNQLKCSRDSIHFFDESWVFDGNITKWDWYFDDAYHDNDTSGAQNPSYYFYAGGDYNTRLIVTSDSACSDTIIQQVYLNPAPINHLYSSVDFGCGLEEEIVFRDTAYLAEGAIEYYKWIFAFNDTVYTQVDSLVHPLDPGVYNVISEVMSEIGCVGTDSLSGFNVYDKPIADFSYYPEEITISNPEVAFNNMSIGSESSLEHYHWDFGDGTDTVGMEPIHMYQDTGLFNVLLTVQDENGCVDTVSNKLYIDAVFSFYIPNAFSPNGNGINDDFGPIGAYFEDENYEFHIYNRWGELLFETKDPFEKWQGDSKTKSGTIVPLGVYSWIIRVEDALGEEHFYKGMVTVVR